MARLLSVLFWSVLAAAFIGPGTVTAAAAAGQRFGLRLLWALTFSTVACIVLQEASARVTVLSGQDLATALRTRFARSPLRVPALLLVVLAIVFGCAAYQVGNILGAVAGLALVLPLPGAAAALALGAVVFLLLWFGSIKVVARALGVLVALMGGAFVATAWGLLDGPGAAVRAALVPELPAGGTLLTVALIGTTVVPYNLFLGSGLARGQSLGELRFGLTVAIVLGGLVSMAVLVVGTSLTGEFAYDRLAAALADRLGAWAAPFFALGLFGAGLSSAVTAPLAAGLTAQGLFGRTPPGGDPARGAVFRATWILVLACGVAFGVFGVRPIPAIVAAQALNGVLLPCVAVFLFVLLNDRGVVGESGRNGRLANALLGAVVLVAAVLGGTQVVHAL